jgi:hypothetical protein
MMSVTCGKLPRFCRGGGEVMDWKPDLGRRRTLPQATLHYPFGVEM